MALVVSALTLMDNVMAFKLLLTILLAVLFQVNSDAVIVKGLYTSGLAYNTTSIPGGNPPDDPLPNGSNCFLNSQCASNYCAPSGKCEDEPTTTPGTYTNILTVGDSHVLGQLTSSAYYPGGFRFRIQSEMLPTVVNMLGPYKTNPSSSSTYDVDHAGVGGETTAQINARVPNLITNYLSPATCGTNTIVVLEGGYNGLTTAEPAITNQVNEIVSSITRFYNFCPDMPVIFMNLKPFPSNSGTRNTNITTYNARLLTVMSDLQETIPNLWIWDRYATYTDTDNCNGDADNCSQNLCTPAQITAGCITTTSHPSPLGYQLDGHYLGQIIKNGCLSEYNCRPNPLP